MKNIFYLIIVTMLLCTSCSSETANLNEDTTINNSELLYQISYFNDSISKTKVTTRSRSGKILYWMSVISADCSGAYSGGCIGLKCGALVGQPHIGAAIGAVVAGGWASYRVHRVLTRAAIIDKPLTPIKVAGALVAAKEQNIDISKNYSKEIILPLSDSKNEIKAIGAKHNIVLRNLIDDKIDTINLEKSLTKEEFEIINSEQFKQDCEKAINKIQNSFNDNIVQETENRTISDKLMSLFYSICQTYPDNSEDVQFIINKYIEAVKNTNEISEQDKPVIYQAISVAASSYEFWMNEGNIN